MSYALGGVKLQVLPENKIQASLILSNLYNGSYETYLAEEIEDVCPSCNGSAFHTFNKWHTKLGQVTIYLCFGFILRVRDRKKKCKACGEVLEHDAEHTL